MLTLRDYQQESLQAILREFRAGITRQLVSLPTGTGKTILFGALAKELNRKTLIVAHREELLTQARDKILLLWPDADIGIIKAERNEINHQILVASVQTISRPQRLEQLVNRGISLLVIDEAHHAAATSYRKVIAELGFAGADPGKLLVGVTATPQRGDKLGLDSVFQKIVYRRSLPVMIAAGYLADLKGVQVKANVDLSKVHTRAGDFAQGELEAAVNTAEANQIIVKAFKYYASNRRAAAFCAGVQHAKDLADTFNQAGIKASAVWGDMDPESRKATLEAYEAGQIQVLTNCEILTEGWDSPATDCLLMARPTKSGALYQQMIGRGTRLFPGKENCLILEFTSNRHDIASLGTLTGLPIKNKQTILQAMQEERQRRQAASEAKTATRVVAKEFDILDRSAFRWYMAGRDWRLPIAPDIYLSLHEGEPGKWNVVANIVNGQDKAVSLHESLPFGYAQGLAEDYARQHGQAFARKDARWTRQKPTAKQIEMLTKLKIQYDPDISRGEAAQLISEQLARREVEPATSKQLWRLRQMGYTPPEGLTKPQARQMIAAGMG